MELRKSSLIAVFAIVMAVVLAGCANAGSASSASRPSNASNASSGEALYAMTQSTLYSGSGSVQGVTRYTIDERGNITRVDMENSGAPVGTLLYERDENGWPLSQKTLDASGDERANLVLENEFDEQGRLVKSVASGEDASNSAVTTYEYHQNGGVASITTEYNDGRLTREEFDEGGFKTQQVSRDAQGSQTITRQSWALDDQGNPSSLHQSQEVDGTETRTQKLDVETDDAGKIIAYRDASTGAVTQEIEWVQVQDPTLYVSLFNRLVR